MLLIQTARCGRVPIGEATARADARVSRPNFKKLRLLSVDLWGFLGYDVRS
jgi:hypothetical protein